MALSHLQTLLVIAISAVIVATVFTTIDARPNFRQLNADIANAKLRHLKAPIRNKTAQMTPELHAQVNALRLARERATTEQEMSVAALGYTKYDPFVAYADEYIKVWYAPYSTDDNPCNISIAVYIINVGNNDIIAVFIEWNFQVDYESGSVTPPPQTIDLGEEGLHYIFINSYDMYMTFSFVYTLCTEYGCFTSPQNGVQVVDWQFPCNPPTNIAGA